MGKCECFASIHILIPSPLRKCNLSVLYFLYSLSVTSRTLSLCVCSPDTTYFNKKPGTDWFLCLFFIITFSNCSDFDQYRQTLYSNTRSWMIYEARARVNDKCYIYFDCMLSTQVSSQLFYAYFCFKWPEVPVPCFSFDR